MHVTVWKFLLVRIYFVQFRSHLSVCVSSTNLSTENMAALGSSSWLTVSLSSVETWSCMWTSSWIYLWYNMHLVLIIHHKFLGIASVSCTHSSTGPSACNDLALGSHCWYLVVVFLYRRQIYVSTRLSIGFIIFIINCRRHLSINQIAFVGLGRVTKKFATVIDLADRLWLFTA